MNVDFSLREVPAQHFGPGAFLGLDRGDRAKEALVVSYDELYPDDPIRSLIEKTCIQCHGQNFLSFFHQNTEEWDAAIGLMLENRIPPGTINSQQRKDVAQYLSAHFGPDSPDRMLKMEVETPLTRNMRQLSPRRSMLNSFCLWIRVAHVVGCRKSTSISTATSGTRNV